MIMVPITEPVTTVWNIELIKTPTVTQPNALTKKNKTQAMGEEFWKVR